MKLFEYAVYYVPAEEENAQGQKAVVLVKPTTALAKSEDQARTLASRAIPEEYLEKLDQVTVVIRPFA